MAWRKNIRVGLARSIWANNGGEIGITKQEGVVAFVGLEVCGSSWRWLVTGATTRCSQWKAGDRGDALNNSKRMSLPIVTVGGDDDDGRAD